MELELFPDFHPKNPPRTLDESHPFYKKNITFTGTLPCIHRHDAAVYVERVGGLVGSCVSRKTDILIVGELKGESSLKLARASELNKQIMDADDFLQVYMTRL